MPCGRSSRRSESLSPSSPNFDALYAPDQWQAHPPADGAHVHDPAPSAAQRGEKRLGDRRLADEVDLELLAQLVDREELERRGHSDAGVVHEPDQRLVSERITRSGDLVRVRHVDAGGAQAASLQPLRILVFAHRCDRVEAELAQVQDGGLADARGGTGHEDCSGGHGEEPIR